MSRTVAIKEVASYGGAHSLRHDHRRRFLPLLEDFSRWPIQGPLEGTRQRWDNTRLPPLDPLAAEAQG